MIDVYKKLCVLKELSGRAKETRFQMFLNEDSLFKKVVKYAVDPKKSYNIRKFEFLGNSATADIGKAFGFLDELATKRGATDEDVFRLSRLTDKDTITHEVFHRILLKDLKCGIGLTLASKYIDSIEKHAVCLCDKDVDKFLKSVGHEINRIAISLKLDGVRVYAIVSGNGDVQYLSRNGLPFKNFKKFDKELFDWANKLMDNPYSKVTQWPVTFDGEVRATSKKFEAIMKQLHRMVEVDTTHLKFSVFDCPSIPGALENRYYILQNHPAMESVELLEHITCRKPSTIGLKEALIAEAEKVFLEGDEGLVIKDWKSEYVHKRTKSWCKLVATHTEDLYVIGWYKGEPGTKYENSLGGLYVDYNGVKVGVGSGFSDEERQAFVKKQPKMIEVAYREVTPDGSLRFPRFKRIRHDKS